MGVFVVVVTAILDTDDEHVERRAWEAPAARLAEVFGVDGTAAMADDGSADQDLGGATMFDDPQVVIGMLIGIFIIAGGTYLGVSSQRKRERHDAGL